MPADENNPVLNRQNLTIRVHMQLSQEQKTFSNFFPRFLKCAINLKYLEKKDNPHRFCISEITNSQDMVR